MKLTDDILNKFIDGELNSDDAAEVKRLLESSPEDQKNFTLLNAIHNSLRHIKEEEVSSDFTNLVMGRISGLGKRKSDNFFIVSISSVFVFISLLIIGFVSYQIISANNSTESFSLLDRTGDIADTIISMFKNFKNSSGLSILGAVFSFAMLITGYFFFEHQKNLAKLK